MLLPVGTDYTPPNKWVTEIHRDWNARYTWPRFVCALPREFFAAVRAELDERGSAPSPQTRDMNPIYTGKDVSYIDTKQANRAAENAVLDGRAVRGVRRRCWPAPTIPQAALAKAWVQLAYGAHHDAITGSESDQVYLDLLTGWRDAWELGRAARDNALRRCLPAPSTGRRRGVESVDAQANRHRHGPAGRAARPTVRGCSTPTATSCPHWSSTAGDRSAGWPATCRRWAGGPTGWSRGVGADGLGTRGRRSARSPTSTTGCASTRPAAAAVSVPDR